MRDRKLFLRLAHSVMRYCFDHYRPITSLSKIIDSHFQENNIHTPGTVAEYYLNAVTKAGQISWSASIPGKNKFIYSLENAIREIESAIDEKAYLDVHAWCFAPHSFRLIIHDLFHLGLIPFKRWIFYLQ
jgi:hypothetical protein